MSLRILFVACFSVFASLTYAQDADTSPLSSSDSETAPEPKMELGIGLAVQSLRDYRGSTEHQTNALPFPYIVYRGDFIELDRDSAKGKLFSSDNIELAVSADASYTEDSKNNPLRVGMDPLDPTFELGPSLEVNLTGEDLDQGWMARFPVRGVFSVDIPDIRQQGWLVNPKVTYKHPDLWNNTNFKFDAGFLYGDADYHEYLYGVSTADATAARPEFEASAGYSGAFIKLGVDRRIDNWWIKSYVRYDNLSGAENNNSPLYETDHYVSAGLAIAWVFWESSLEQ